MQRVQRVAREQPSVPTGSGPWARAVYTPAILLAAGFSLATAAKLGAAVGPGTWLPLLAGAALGILCADFVTGAVHWACDTWGSERTPLLGQALIRSFREHHRLPRAMLGHDWIEVNGSAATAAALAWAIFTLAPAVPRLEMAPFAHAFFWALASVAPLGNQLHRWAHTRVPPRPVRWLQRARLVLSPGPHARHHRAPHTAAYCIATGWANPLLDAVGFWRGLERCIARVTGVAPRAASKSRKQREKR